MRIRDRLQTETRVSVHLEDTVTSRRWRALPDSESGFKLYPIVPEDPRRYSDQIAQSLARVRGAVRHGPGAEWDLFDDQGHSVMRAIGKPEAEIIARERFAEGVPYVRFVHQPTGREFIIAPSYSEQGFESYEFAFIDDVATVNGRPFEEMEDRVPALVAAVMLHRAGVSVDEDEVEEEQQSDPEWVPDAPVATEYEKKLVGQFYNRRGWLDMDKIRLLELRRERAAENEKRQRDREREERRGVTLKDLKDLSLLLPPKEELEASEFVSLEDLAELEEEAGEVRDAGTVPSGLEPGVELGESDVADEEDEYYYGDEDDYDEEELAEPESIPGFDRDFYVGEYEEEQ